MEKTAIKPTDSQWTDIYNRVLERRRLGLPEPFEYEGPFPFLDLPPEICEKIYGFCTPEGYQFNVYPWPETPDEGVTLKNYEDRKNTIPVLLRTCRQIYHETKHFSYRNGVFEIDVHLNTQLHKLSLFEPELQNEIRHMSLNIVDGYTRHFYPKSPGNPESIDKAWVYLLGHLFTLELMIHHPSVEFCLNYGLDELQDDPEWNDLLKRRLQAINRLVPKETEIMVDVNGEDMVLKLVEEAMPNRCIFGNLKAGDDRFDRGFHTRPKYDTADDEIDDEEETGPEWDYDLIYHNSIY